MSQLGGYTGKILRIDLTNQQSRTEEMDEQVYRRFMGGAGLVSYFLLAEVPPDSDPLGPANKLIFANGPITGTSIPGSGRLCIGGRSPLTNGVAKSEVGEHFGTALKWAGCDAVIVEGRAKKPVYLVIQDGKVSFHSAEHLWGKKTKETQTLVHEELNDRKYRLAMIGPGGENQVLYACIMCGLIDAAGRGGLGAVMGSKNLKAIAVRGSNKPTVHNKDGVTNLVKSFRDNNLPTAAGLAETGTSPTQIHFEPCGNLPIHNFRDGAFPTHSRITAVHIKETIRVGMEGCWACPIKCKKIVKADKPYRVDPAYGGPEYETLGAFGSNCGVDDVVAISKANELCNAYSLDTISTGVAIGFAMELFENGLLTKTDTGGMDLRFGNAEAVLELIEQIAFRKRLGEVLSLGVARAADRIGGAASEYAMHVKKLELPMHDPRLSKGLGLGYMLSPIGADHMMSLLDFIFSGFGKSGKTTVPDAIALGVEPALFESIDSSKIYMAHMFTMKRILQDSMVLCGLVPYSYQTMTEQIRCVVGWDTTEVEQLRIAQRILTALRLYNIRCGLTSEDDVLPQRFFEPRQGGNFQGSLDPGEMERAKKYYYSLMGWDERGTPSEEKLKELCIIS